MLKIINTVVVVAALAAGFSPWSAYGAITQINNHSSGEIKSFCTKTGGNFYSNEHGVYGCTASDGGSAVECKKDKTCNKIVYLVNSDSRGILAPKTVVLGR